MFRRLRSWTLVLVIASAATGCSSGRNPTVLPTEFVERPKITPAVLSLVGEGPAQQAAATAVGFAREYGFDPALLDPQQATFTVEELSAGVGDVLGDAALRVWDARVVAAAAGDTEAWDDVRALKMFGLQDRALTVPKDGDVLRSQSITDVTVDVVPSAASGGSVAGPSTEPTADTATLPKLLVDFTQVAHLRFEEKGDRREVVFTRHVTYRMAQVETASDVAVSLPGPTQDSNPAGLSDTGSWLIVEYFGPYEYEAYELLG